ncbi:MAG TPA: RNA polymerase sigma factor [Candidatus Polarisedimenticolia bacterium]|nr:RNA polymerase sigma factor [Candidatus Polarisedimenticolia bacterium]
MGAEGEATSAALRSGNREDFDRLYRENYPRLLRTLYAITGDSAAAEDCVQEAFVKAWRAWPRFRPERAPEGWLHQIAVNTAISYRRRAKLRSVGEILRRLGRPAAGRDPADAATASDVIKALAALPPRVAADFVLRYHHGYNNREIARLEGVSERTVGTRLAHARDELSRRLGPDWRGKLPTSETAGVHFPRGRSGVSDA